MKIHFAADHAGFEMKNELINYVRDELGHEVVDHGAYEYNEQDDYPDFINKAMTAIGSAADRAIILGGSGQGEAMAANRFPGVRATVFYGGPLEIITLSREHNDANVLSLGARFLDLDTAKQTVKTWLKTSFSADERHQRRLQKIDSRA